MRKLILGSLLATLALSPAMAQRDDRGSNRERGEMRQRAPENRDDSAGGWQNRRQQPAAAPATAPQPAPQANTDWRSQRRNSDVAPSPLPRSENRDHARGTGGGWNRRDRGNVAQPAPAPVQQQRRADTRPNDGRNSEMRTGTPARPANPYSNRRNPEYNGDRNNNDGRRGENHRDDRNGHDWRRGNDHDNNSWQRNNNGRWERHQGDNRHWNNGWRNDRRYNWQQYRQSNRNHYRAPRYYHPYGYGYGYRRFGIGISLDQLFYGRNYWINDPWDYHLPQAYGSYQWVRYYDDVLLVDLRTGRVVDVIYDFFW